jgi:hypothetical protein
VEGAGAGGAGVGVSTAGGFAVVSGVFFTVEALLAFSLSFVVRTGDLDFAACFEFPPKTLFRMFHFPLLVSSSGKSCESVDMDEVGRASGSVGTGFVGLGFRW